MRGWRFHGWTMRGIAAALFALAAPLTLTACAATSYAGIPLQAGAADPELQQLARRAQAGDKHAQLELGIRYEEGRGVPVDVVRAIELYRRAATARGETSLMYMPGQGSGGGAMVAPVDTGVESPALSTAVRRLYLLTKLCGSPKERLVSVKCARERSR